MIPPEHGAASADMQLCCSFCELGYHSGLATFLLVVCNASAALSLRIVPSSHPERCDDFDMLKDAVRLVPEVVLKVHLRSPNLQNMFVGWQIVEISSMPPFSHRKLYNAVPSR